MTVWVNCANTWRIIIPYIAFMYAIWFILGYAALADRFRPAHLLLLLPLLLPLSFVPYLFDRLARDGFDVVDEGDELVFRQRRLFGRATSLPKAKLRWVELTHVTKITSTVGDTGYPGEHISHLFMLDVVALGPANFRVIEWFQHGPGAHFGEQAAAVADCLSQFIGVKSVLKNTFYRN